MEMKHLTNLSFVSPALAKLILTETKYQTKCNTGEQFCLKTAALRWAAGDIPASAPWSFNEVGGGHW